MGLCMFMCFCVSVNETHILVTSLLIRGSCFIFAQAIDSVVESAMTGSMAEKTTFEGFTFKGDNQMS
jgi:hypothetical protein